MSDRNTDRKIMSDVFVTNAQEWANELVRRESRGPGDYENAMRRLESRYGIPWQILWRLRHGRIKDVYVSIYVRLQAAYQAECERQMRLLAHEIEIAKAKGLAGSPAVAKAEALVGKMEEA
jgi:hypothetical protein